MLHHHSCAHLPARDADDKLVIADPAGANDVFSDVIPHSFFIHRKPEVLSWLLSVIQKQETKQKADFVTLSIFVLWPDYSTAGSSSIFEDVIWSKCMDSCNWALRSDSDKWQNSVWLKLKADRLGYGLRPSLVFCISCFQNCWYGPVLELCPVITALYLDQQEGVTWRFCHCLKTRRECRKSWAFSLFFECVLINQ